MALYGLILTGSKDWEWWDDSVPDKLKDLDKNNYRVVFFTNQAGIEKMKVSEEEIKIKIEHMIKELGIPIYVSLRHICKHVSPYIENKYFEYKIMIIFLMHPILDENMKNTTNIILCPAC